MNNSKPIPAPNKIIPIKVLPKGQTGNTVVTNDKEFFPTDNLDFATACNYVIRGYKVWCLDALELSEYLGMLQESNGVWAIAVINEYLGSRWLILTDKIITSNKYYIDLTKAYLGWWADPLTLSQRQGEINDKSIY